MSDAPTGPLNVPYREREKSITIERGDDGTAPRLASTELEPDDGALHDQHRPAPPGDARGAAPAADARGRDRPRRRADHRLRPHRHREVAARTRQYWKVIPFVERMDYLSYYFNAMAYCMAVERLLDERGAAARAVPARDPPRAEPDRQPPVLARHLRARPRRDLDALVGLPRARPRARPVRDVVAASACTRATSRSAA